MILVWDIRGHKICACFSDCEVIELWQEKGIIGRIYFTLGIGNTAALMATVLRDHLLTRALEEQHFLWWVSPYEKSLCIRKFISHTQSGRSRHGKMSRGGFCEDFLEQSLEIIMEPTLISTVLQFKTPVPHTDAGNGAWRDNVASKIITYLDRDSSEQISGLLT